ncbi:hypothetical protein A4X09_0g6632 [Tilletia walkeri]|uniref:Uncharacterized protein n=1 Tax=Tilletia walkeri TaxID=117179 RepID=A0A8X7N4S5_9BASI|nr:hypothetical protein A4X09_0g6632 [Tilletia walkeri]
MNPAAFDGVSNGTSRPSWDDDRANRIGGNDRESERSMTMEDSRLATGRQGYASGYGPAMLDEHALAQAKAQRTFLANLPRVGELLTLDLKSNDIGSGVAYLAQALKKNRTLRVLNLSDCNMLDGPAGDAPLPAMRAETICSYAHRSETRLVL